MNNAIVDWFTDDGDTLLDESVRWIPRRLVMICIRLVLVLLGFVHPIFWCLGLLWVLFVGALSLTCRVVQ